METNIYKINLSNLERATAQEVFDQIVAHLRKQGKRSKDLTGTDSCMYRNQEGLMCAAGCLISEEEYDETKMDRDSEGDIGMGWRELVHKGIVPDAHAEMICKLQNVHDSNTRPEDWEPGFKLVAGQFELEYKEGEVKNV